MRRTWSLVFCIVLLGSLATLSSADERKAPQVKSGAFPEATMSVLRAFSEIPEVEPNDSPAEAQALSCGDALNPASLLNAAARDTDWVVFSAGAGDLITFATSEAVPGPETDTVVDLLAADGATVLAVNDDYGGSKYARIESFLAPYSGIYYGFVRGFQGAEGDYRLDVTCVPAPPVPPNDGCAGAIAIACGDIALSGYTYAAANDYDLCPGSQTCATSCTGFGSPGRDVVYRIDVPVSGAMLNVTYDIVPSASDASIYLVTDCGDVAGSCVAGSDSPSGQPAETLTYTFPGLGTYYLILDAFQPDAGGAWTLTGELACPTDSRRLTWGALKTIYR